MKKIFLVGFLLAVLGATAQDLSLYQKKEYKHSDGKEKSKILILSKNAKAITQP